MRADTNIEGRRGGELGGLQWEGTLSRYAGAKQGPQQVGFRGSMTCPLTLGAVTNLCLFQ